MLPYVPTSLLAARRSPGAWLILGLGCASLALGLGLAVLAFEADPAAERELVGECAAGTGAAVALWVLITALARDRLEGFALAADQTGPGAVARLLGRSIGALVAGVVAAAATLAFAVALDPQHVHGLLCLLSTSMVSVASAAAWGLMLGACGLGPAAGLLAGLGLWFLGHLPWSSPGWEVGGLGRLLAVALPSPPADAGADAWRLLAALGLGAVALTAHGARARDAGSG